MRDISRWIAEDRGYSTPCWIWQGSINKVSGYPVIGRGPGHRYIYEFVHNVQLPHEIQVDHLCGVRPCVNPDHLEAVTQAENIRRQLAARPRKPKTHCFHGHPLSGDNIRMAVHSVNGATYRRCRNCERNNLRAQRARRRALAQREGVRQ